jgi:hypothetical protein
MAGAENGEIARAANQRRRLVPFRLVGAADAQIGEILEEAKRSGDLRQLLATVV